ncbi:divalent-cation tolerance protein CutA [Ramlibacter tataouinensis]|uniref:divalent-cation tolerance protein CutA n=1 Tax=Ramlibacter tataouinensis TaxID=94132 RepID=UPI0022F38965|nr:divalent-cation tolerance protein CutA [Ramlibacter tataouinensis]WBY00485.1 divalent-cation tolerance protein CutA [Ramlibacter tataouinensis]
MGDFTETGILSLTTTVGSADDGRRLAQALVKRRLAACVQVEEGLQSHYRWQGRLCAEAEVRLTVKSLPSLLPQLQAFFAESHPYELPQLLWQVMQASPAYAGWVRQEVGSAP